MMNRKYHTHIHLDGEYVYSRVMDVVEITYHLPPKHEKIDESNEYFISNIDVRMDLRPVYNYDIILECEVFMDNRTGHRKFSQEISNRGGSVTMSIPETFLLDNLKRLVVYDRENYPRLRIKLSSVDEDLDLSFLNKGSVIYVDYSYQKLK